MKARLLLLLLLLPACARDIAGFSRDERLTLYGTALTLAGKPEFGAIAYGLRRPVTSAKNPLPELRTGVSALPSKPRTENREPKTLTP